MPLLRNDGSTKLLRNASSTDLVRSLDASCPDPCDGCIPGDQSLLPSCVHVILSGVGVVPLCPHGSAGGLYVLQFSSGLNENPIRAFDYELDGVRGLYYSFNDVTGESLVSKVRVAYQDVDPDDPGGYNPFFTYFRMSAEVDLTLCNDSRIRINSVRVLISTEVSAEYVFRWAGCEPGQGEKYVGDILPNELRHPNCVTRATEPCIFPLYYFGDALGTATVIPGSCGVQEPIVVNAYDCPTGLSKIQVRLDDMPISGDEEPYYPKNGGVLYRPDETTSDPALLGTTWVQEECGDPLYPEVVRCDAVPGTLTYDPADRPSGTNIFTVGGIDYTPSGGTSTTSPSSGVWSSGVCGSLLLATRCNSDDIPNVPGDVEAQIPANISYDSALLNGGLPEDFTIGMRLIVQRDMGGGLSQDFCLEIPYQCTNLPATGNELQSYQVQEIDCNSWGLGSSGQGALCDVGGPGGGLDCANICCPANGGDCDAEPWCGFCQCCWNVFPE